MANREWWIVTPIQHDKIEQDVQTIQKLWFDACNCKSDRHHHPDEAKNLYDTVEHLLDLLEQTTNVID